MEGQEESPSASSSCSGTMSQRRPVGAVVAFEEERVAAGAAAVEDDEEFDGDDDYTGRVVVAFRCRLELPPPVPFPSSSSSILTTTLTTTAATESSAATTVVELEFRCRDGSVGVLREDENRSRRRRRAAAQQVEEVLDSQQDDEEEEFTSVDPNFFDRGYTLAGRTGFQVWAGTRMLVEALLSATGSMVPSSSRHGDEDRRSPSFAGNSGEDDSSRRRQRLEYWQRMLFEGAPSTSTSSPTGSHRRRRRPLRVLELGSGVGVAGTALASVGAEVLLTDLPTLVKHSLRPNLRRNDNKRRGRSSDGNDDTIDPDQNPPTWLLRQLSERRRPQECPETSATAGKMADVVAPIGRGWAAAAPLDWTRPVREQLPALFSSRDDEAAGNGGVDLIVASDCVWLKSMLDALLDTVSCIFEESVAAAAAAKIRSVSSNGSTSPPSFLMSFQRRDPAAADSGSGSSGDIRENHSSSSSSNNSSSSMFTTASGVAEAVRHRGWTIDCLATSTVAGCPTTAATAASSKTSEVFLFEIRSQK